MNINRVFVIVLDSYGIGHAPDAADFGDEGANTLGTIRRSKEYHTPNMEKSLPRPAPSTGAACSS